MAGGASRRMGCDKALLRLDGQVLAVRTAEVLIAAGCAPVVLVGNQPALQGLGMPVLREPLGAHHPLRGVAVALAALGDTVVAPCDLVGLVPEHIQALRGGGPSCVAEVEGRLQPLLGCFGADLAALAKETAIAGGSARGWAAALKRVALDCRAARNLNAPEDLAAWRAETR